MCSNKTEYKKVCCDTELITEPFDESKQKQQNVSDICPVGTILPWMNRIKSPSGQFLISPDVPPPGWELCDGQTISQGAWKGSQVPHINQDRGLFLRGGPHYLCGKTEMDTIQDHIHSSNLAESDGGHGGVKNEEKLGLETRPTNVRVRCIMKVQ